MSSRNAILIVLITSLLFLLPLLRPGFYESHDGEIHLVRFAAYYKAFTDGQLPPRWAPDVNYGYGSPLFIFFYSLPGYLGSLLHLIGFTLENAFKILVIFAFLLAPLSFYAFAIKLFRREVAFAGALLYGLLPYHFLDLYVRGDIGEMMGFVFIPLVLLSIEKMLAKPMLLTFLLGSISYALLMLSHNGITLMFTPLFLAYIFIRAKSKKLFALCFSFFTFGLLLTIFFWLPALYESRYINKNLFANTYQEHFPKLSQLIYSPWGFGTDVQKSGGLSPQIGPLHVLLVLAAIAFLKRIKVKRTFGFWFLTFLIGIFFTTFASSFLWDKVGLLQNFQFPWRFTALSGFASVMVGGYLLNVINSKKLLFVILVLIITSLPLIRVSGITTKEDSYYFAFDGTPYHHGEATTVWTAGNPGERPKSSFEIISGSGQVQEISRRSNLHTFNVLADTNLQLLDNTIYFPGWQASVDGKKVKIEFQDINHRGLITFPVPKGTHRVDVIFGESPVRLFSDIISGVALLALLPIFIIKRRR